MTSFDGTFDLANGDGSGHWAVDVADVTGDGHADLVTEHEESVHVFPGQPSGAFGDPVVSLAGALDRANLDATGRWLAGVAAIDGDEWGDLVAMGDGNAWVWPGEASGSFGNPIASFDGTLDVANLDGTGHFIVAPNGPDVAHAPSTSTSASSGSGAQSSTTTTASAGGASNAPASAEGLEGDGCSCRTAPGGGHSLTACWWLLAAAAWRRRRRRRVG